MTNLEMKENFYKNQLVSLKEQEKKCSSKASYDIVHIQVIGIKNTLKDIFTERIEQKMKGINV